MQIVGGYSPPFRPLTDEEHEAVAAEINALAAPTSSGSGSACPSRRSGWRRCAPRSTAPVLVGVGAAFDFHAGLVPQAPDWIQEAGLEWAYRLAHEPRRLWRRYPRYNPRFVAAFARQLPLTVSRAERPADQDRAVPRDAATAACGASTCRNALRHVVLVASVTFGLSGRLSVRSEISFATGKCSGREAVRLR